MCIRDSLSRWRPSGRVVRLVPIHIHKLHCKQAQAQRMSLELSRLSNPKAGALLCVGKEVAPSG
eukprot:9759802-Lingulodinium_polyedra.AAC.1